MGYHIMPHAAKRCRLTTSRPIIKMKRSFTTGTSKHLNVNDLLSEDTQRAKTKVKSKSQRPADNHLTHRFSMQYNITSGKPSCNFGMDKKDSHTYTDTYTDKGTQTQTQSQAHRHKHTDTDTDAETDTHTHTHI